MGACTGKPQIKSPAILSSAMDPTLVTTGTLDLNIQLSNIKLFLQGRFKHVQLKWKGNFEGSLRASESELREKVITISVRSQDSSILGQLELNWFQIATGPYQFEYAIRNSKQKSIGSISFRLRVLQIVEMKLDVFTLECQFYDSIIEQAYNYSLRLVTNSQSFQSEHSLTQKNPSYVSSPSKKRENFSFREEYQKISWKDQVGIIVQLPIQDLGESALQILVWYVNQFDEQYNEEKIRSQQKKVCTKKKDYRILDHHLVGETYINMGYLQMEIEESLNAHIFHKKLSKQLWNHGIRIGEIKLDFYFELPAHLKQMDLGVRTENGIQQSTNAFTQNKETGDQEVSRDQLICQISELASQFSRLSSSLFKFQSKKLDAQQKLQTKAGIEVRLEKVLELLSKPNQNYKSRGELLNAQETLIEILNELLECHQFLEQLCYDNYYRCLSQGWLRKELSLDQMGYSQDLLTNQKQHKKKVAIGCSFQKLMYNTLKFVLNKIEQKDPGYYQRLFCDEFLALAYFRIPQFRTKFLSFLIKPNDPKLNIRGYNFLIKEDQQVESMDSLNWEQFFYNQISSNEEAEKNEQIVERIVEDASWKVAFESRQSNFYYFVEQWAKYLERQFNLKDLKWWNVPGYQTVVRAFFTVLEEEEVKEVPEQFQVSLKYMLYNSKLLSVMVSILYRKAKQGGRVLMVSLYEIRNVIQTFDVVNFALSSLQELKQAMPSYFDYLFFFKGFQVVLLECEHAFAIAKCLSLVYNHYQFFPLDFQTEITQLIFDHTAFKLFLHWSSTVRFVFHHLILYRVFHLHRTAQVNTQNEEALYQQLMIVMKPKRQHSYCDNTSPQKKLTSDFIMVKYYRFMNVIEQAFKDHQKLNTPEPHTLYFRMKKTLEEKKTRKELRKSHSKKTSSIVLIAETDKKELEQLEPIIEEQVQTQPIVIERRIHHKKLNCTPTPHLYPLDKQPIELTHQQYQYLQTARNEFQHLMKNYNNWKQLKLKQELMNRTLTTQVSRKINHSSQIPSTCDQCDRQD